MPFAASKPLLRAPPVTLPSAAPRRRRSAPSASLSSSQCRISLPSNPPSAKTLTLALSSAVAASGLIFSLSSPSGGGGGLGGGPGGGSGGGGSGGGGGSFWSQIFSPLAAYGKDDDENHKDWDSHGLPADIAIPFTKLSAMKRYKISDILLFDRRRATTTPAADESFSEFLSLRPGGIYTKPRLTAELDALASCGMFDKVDLEARTKPDGTLALTVAFTEAVWNTSDSFRCINVGLMPHLAQPSMDADMTQREKLEQQRRLDREYRKRIERSGACMLPVSVHKELADMMRGQGKLSARILHRVMHRVQEWYHNEGYIMAGVVNFGNLHNREIVCEVGEGDITKLDVMFYDKLGNPTEGNTQLAVIHRAIPKQLQQGHVFNIEAAKQALKNLNSLGLFSNIEVDQQPDKKRLGGAKVKIKLKEMDQKSAEVSTEWSIVPGSQGRPTLASIQPGGTISFEQRNIKGLNRSILGSVTSSNLLNPQDDLAFKLEYVHPYVDGVDNPRNRTFRANCFNSRKLSPVFNGGSTLDEVPPVWIDRVGLKANITEAFTPQSKFTYGLVMEEITTRDENSNICTHGSRPLPNGGLSSNGPPTTLCGTGIDRMAFAQANITRDNTKYVNGALVGERDVFQLDQGLGIGSNFPFFNRHQLSLTRFIQLKPVEEGSGKSQPPVLVLHGHYGGCVGDLPSYDAFTLGGPYSVRGYNMGELGACRNILELAAELRVPIKNTYVYAFAEHGNDLGSSKYVKGNPTEFFQRSGQGSSYGIGAKLGQIRAEYAVDHNSGTGAVFFRFGERF